LQLLLKIICASAGRHDDIDSYLSDSSLHTPQTKVGDAIGAVEVVAKRQGLTPEHLDSLVEFVVGQGRASE